jgi:hypothetical protein
VSHNFLCSHENMMAHAVFLWSGLCINISKPEKKYDILFTALRVALKALTFALKDSAEALVNDYQRS